MEIRELTGEQIRRVYTERITRDFAPDEVKPLSRIEEALAAGHYACRGAFGGDGLLAYAFFVVDGSRALLDYLAVREDLRGKGIGGAFLRAMADWMTRRFDSVLLESEDPDYARSDHARRVMERRIGFYLRNGLAETGVTSSVWRVRYRVLSFPVGKKLSAGETREVYRALYRALLPEELYETMVRVR